VTLAHFQNYVQITAEKPLLWLTSVC